jgi:hypothetical protein
VTLIGWLAVFGPPPRLVLSPSAVAAYETLSKAEYFAGPAVGIAGVEPRESKALRSLAADPRGGSAFRYLLLNASPAARLYGLVGLRHTNPTLFRVAVQPFRIWPGDVQTWFGCGIRSEPVRDVVATRGEHPVRLRDGESLVEWWKRRPPQTGMDLDIIGGGYTSMFVDFAELRRPAG